MMGKIHTLLISITSAILILSVAGWYFILQPSQQQDMKQAEELLVSGINLFKEKKYDEALETLQRIPSGSVHEAQARYYQGSAHMMLKNFEPAVNNLEQALALNSEDSSILYALGVVYYKLGHIKLAKSYFSSVLDINPNDQQAKGLMDIMARLERRSVAKPESEQSDLTSTLEIEESSSN